ncbi:DNA glycosylase [Rugosibacter aromaticivorans]|uniref:DNA glycosylase n=1 Tax=Rugosibacter aromaticivorans TaxID=1565605 RepID=A0A0C5IZ82_9PROT|nr:DNA-deoxyinosine glycosylase [Rugosibacter aromaticivorans]AJP48072.1 DNA glycosylase [Rugosibacter aromaticivorans]TBR13563.1 MAG: DNA-deoxyinosine glycosylase [Rugosibacter sp.]
MSRIQSFEPIETKNAEILILGSMPGRASLAAGQYYAHTQNAFWRIVSELLGFDDASPYPARIAALKSARIALWDVLQSCTRQGSLDARIDRDTEIANDFRTFFHTHKKITHVFFNGAKAEACFNRHVMREIETGPISYLRLPSTSPANASMSLAHKLRAWRVIVGAKQAMQAMQPTSILLDQ